MFGVAVAIAHYFHPTVFCFQHLRISKHTHKFVHEIWSQATCQRKMACLPRLACDSVIVCNVHNYAIKARVNRVDTLCAWCAKHDFVMMLLFILSVCVCVSAYVVHVFLVLTVDYTFEMIHFVYRVFHKRISLMLRFSSLSLWCHVVYVSVWIAFFYCYNNSCSCLFCFVCLMPSLYLCIYLSITHTHAHTHTHSIRRMTNWFNY